MGATVAATRSDVVVIGGGIAGTAAVYRLACAGARAVLVDRGDDGQATAAGAGIIAPGTSLGDNPLFLTLATPAVRFYPELIAQLAEDGETVTGFEVCGALFVATSDEEAALLPDVFRIYQERQAVGVPNMGEVRRLTGREARELFPPLAEHPGAILVPAAARVDGRLIRDAMRRAAERRGARIVRGNARPAVSGGRVSGVRIEGGDTAERLTADAVVIAAGAWSNELGDVLGAPLPTAPQRGQILHLDVPGAETGAWPIILGFHDQYILTFRPNRVVAGASRETGSGFDYRLTAGGTHGVLTQALRVAPGLASATVAEWRIGMRPASPDGLPILGPLPGLANAYVATGFGASGLQLGPWSGATAADLAMGGGSPIDLGPFGAGRFG
jgi:D-amino-acid dehydrogenase